MVCRRRPHVPVSRRPAACEQFPGLFRKSFASKLQALAQTGDRDDIEFVIRVMSSYHGEAFLNGTCKAVVGALPADDPLLSEVEVILQSTGIVSGEFGIRRGLHEEERGNGRLAHRFDAHVRAFAEKFMLFLDRRIATEQRRSEENIELRKRMYDDPGAGGET